VGNIGGERNLYEKNYGANLENIGGERKDFGEKKDLGTDFKNISGERKEFGSNLETGLVKTDIPSEKNEDINLGKSGFDRNRENLDFVRKGNEGNIGKEEQLGFTKDIDMPLDQRHLGNQDYYRDIKRDDQNIDLGKKEDIKEPLLGEKDKGFDKIYDTFNKDIGGNKDIQRMDRERENVNIGSDIGRSDLRGNMDFDKNIDRTGDKFNQGNLNRDITSGKSDISGNFDFDKNIDRTGDRFNQANLNRDVTSNVKDFNVERKPEMKDVDKFGDNFNQANLNRDIDVKDYGREERGQEKMDVDRNIVNYGDTFNQANLNRDTDLNRDVNVKDFGREERKIDNMDLGKGNLKDFDKDKNRPLLQRREEPLTSKEIPSEVKGKRDIEGERFGDKGKQENIQLKHGLGEQEFNPSSRPYHHSYDLDKPQVKEVIGSANTENIENVENKENLSKNINIGKTEDVDVKGTDIKGTDIKGTQKGQQEIKHVVPEKEIL